ADARARRLRPHDCLRRRGRGAGGRGRGLGKVQELWSVMHISEEVIPLREDSERVHGEAGEKGEDDKARPGARPKNAHGSASQRRAEGEGRIDGRGREGEGSQGPDRWEAPEGRGAREGRRLRAGPPRRCRSRGDGGLTGVLWTS